MRNLRANTQSGIGRENGPEMIEEHRQTQRVWLDIGAEAANPFAQK
ncbi:hypothetical protein [Marinivivus vitaminiproducens]|nr:hypothetical protein P4R82_20365 [Geminicoccaceae bacterium SCSIO 64248]